jgi:hypothetical protein
MGLRNLVTPSFTVLLPGAPGTEQSFTVRGVTTNQVITLYNRRRDQLEPLFARLANEKLVAVSQEANAELATVLLNQSPLLMAEVIAIAAGGNPYDDSPADPEHPDGMTAWQADVAMAIDLPAPVQLDALQKIGALTFSPEMPPGKFVRVLVEMMKGATRNLSPSTASSEGSVAA